MNLGSFDECCYFVLFLIFLSILRWWKEIIGNIMDENIGIYN